jgi:hypothetical protein
MIILKPGTNDAVLTLNEKFGFYSPNASTYGDLFYYFRIENELNHSTIDFAISSLADTGDGTRYNKLPISVTFSATASAGTNETWGRPYTIWLYGNNNDFGAQWNYTVWACEGPIPDPGLTMSLPSLTQSNPPVIVEEGKLRFVEL